MDTEVLNKIAIDAVTKFGKTSAHAVSITEFTDTTDLSDRKWVNLIADVKDFLEATKEITFDENTDRFADLVHTIRDADQFAFMHILGAMSRLRELHPIGETLARWVEITKIRKELKPA
jgi:hypothetical protein